MEHWTVLHQQPIISRIQSHMTQPTNQQQAMSLESQRKSTLLKIREGKTVKISVLIVCENVIRKKMLRSRESVE